MLSDDVFIKLLFSEWIIAIGPAGTIGAGLLLLMPKFRILINGSTVQNGLMEPMSFANYAAAELYARRHFARSPDVFSIVIVTESIINNNQDSDV